MVDLQDVTKLLVGTKFSVFMDCHNYLTGINFVDPIFSSISLLQVNLNSKLCACLQLHFL